MSQSPSDITDPNAVFRYRQAWSAINTLRNSGEVKIEFEPELLGGGPTRHFTVSIPGGIRVEFIAPAK